MLRTALAAPLSLLAALVTLLSPTASVAAAPQVLDIVPRGIVGVAVTPSLNRLDQNFGQFLAALDMPELSTPAQMLAVLGLRDGVDMDRPTALIIMVGDFGAPLPPVVLLVPVSDYAAMLRGFGAEEGEGVQEINAAGETLYVKRAPQNYAAICPDRALLDRYEGREGQLGAQAALMGAGGAVIADKADLFVVLHSRTFLQMMGDQRDAMSRWLARRLSIAGMIRLEEDVLAQGVATLLRDSQAITFGVEASSMGLAVRASVNVTPNTGLAAMTAGGGESAPLLDTLPADDVYLLAFGADLNNEGLREMIRSRLDEQGELIPGGPNPIAWMLDAVNGWAGVVYPNPAGFMGGMLLRGVYFFRADEPAQAKDAFAHFLDESSGAIGRNIRTLTTYSPDATTIDGADADAYSIEVMNATGPEATPLALYYGSLQKGPRGYLVTTPDGVYQTTHNDTALVSKALAADKGAPTIGDDLKTSQVARMLSSRRSAEAYIHVAPILEEALAILKLARRSVNVAIPSGMPPVGLALSMGDASALAEAYIPTPVAKTFKDVYTGIAASKQPTGAAPAPGPAGPSPNNN